MRYEGAVFRPPSEANSLIIQVTLGCSYNKCSFCIMYKDKKFRIRKLEDIFEDLEMARASYKSVKKIFLADGDALILKTENLAKILLKIRELFPECERVTSYASAQDVMRKSDEDLKRLRLLGLYMVYIGVESGSDEILGDVNKNSTAADMITAGQKVKKAGIILSVTLISGLGGIEKWELHAVESAKVISAMDPEYLGLLTLGLTKKSPMYDKVAKGEITLLKPKEVMKETRKFVENLEVTNCVLRSNHVSNYVALAATLNREKQQLINQIDSLIKDSAC